MDEFEKYLNKALHFLSFRPRSEKEVRDSLLKKDAPEEIIERVIARLKEHKFVRDEDFAKWFIENRLRFRPKSINIIKLELKQKGIERDIIDSAILEIQNSDVVDVEVNDLDSAKKLVAKRIEKYQGQDKQVIYQKLGSYLARRGFNWDTIKKSIDDILRDGV
jgi:regulatory protein